MSRDAPAGRYSRDSNTRGDPMDSPEIVTRDEWLAARKELLAQEKELTRQRDELNAARRRLPMVEINKDYRFDGPGRRGRAADLFEGRRPAAVYHFMWLVRRGRGLPVVLLPRRQHRRRPHLHARDTSLALVARGPFAESTATAGAWAGRCPLLVARQRLQLRLPRHRRPRRGAGRIQLSRRGRPHQADPPGRAGRASSPARARSSARATASSTPTPRTRVAATS